MQDDWKDLTEEEKKNWCIKKAKETSARKNREGVEEQNETPENQIGRIEFEGSHHGGFITIGGADGSWRRAEPYEIAFKKIETQLEKINGKIDAINAAIEELTRRVFAGKS